MPSATHDSEHVSGKPWKAELERVNRALRVVNKTNKSLHEIDDVLTWLKAVCQSAVDVGGYVTAFVGFAENDAQKAIRMAASAGVEAEYVRAADVTWADEPRGRGPGGTAIRTGRPVIARDIPGDRTFDPWRKDVTRLGYRSSIALPLTSDAQTFGILAMYANEIDAFGPGEVEVLEELARDLAFGLTVVLRIRAERHQADEALKNSNQSLEAKNIALREVLANIEGEQRRMGRQITVNVQEIVLPLMRSLKATLNRRQQRGLDQIEQALEEVASPFIDGLSQAVGSLTPMELRICDFVRRGLAVKEIAEMEHLSPQTVAAHRRNIRRKLGISNQKINLTSYLRATFAQTNARKS